MNSRKDKPVASIASNPAGQVVSDSQGNRAWKWVTHSPGSTSRILARLNDNDLALAGTGAHAVPDEVAHGGDQAAEKEYPRTARPVTSESDCSDRIEFSIVREPGGDATKDGIDLQQLWQRQARLAPPEQFALQASSGPGYEVKAPTRT